MAPPSRVKNRDNKRKNGQIQTWTKKLTIFYHNFVNFEFLQRLFFDPSLLWISASVFLVAEIFVNILVIKKVNYTEIDWVAYMEEVEGVVNGTWDYSLLKGQTGPLVYPAGFVYLFTILYYITSYGKNIRLAQYIFCGFYLLTISLVFRLYARSRKVPPYVLIFICCTSYRIHSIYILRLFNDPVAMLFLYASINLFLDNHWSLGSILFSLAVSIKMNILLFAPALLLAYIASQGIYGTIKQLTICASIQLILGAPFLLTNPVAYLRGSFDLGRVFLFEWTVNWRFLPEDIFVYPGFHILLLLIHLALLGLFSGYWWRLLKSFGKLQIVMQPNGIGMVSQLFLLPLFTANLIGVALSRSLHYQFYVWYFHSLPYLLWCTPFSVWLRIAILGFIELSWNTFPSTYASSAALHICHLLILIGLFIRSRSTNKELNSPVDSKNQ